MGKFETHILQDPTQFLIHDHEMKSFSQQEFEQRSFECTGLESPVLTTSPQYSLARMAYKNRGIARSFPLMGPGESWGGGGLGGSA